MPEYHRLAALLRFVRVTDVSRISCIAALVLGVSSVSAAVMEFDFSSMKVGEAPPGFTSVVTGAGKPGDWKIMEVEAPTAFKPLSPLAQTSSKRAVLAQLSRDTTDEHFPALVYDGEVFGDFKFSTKVRCEAGLVEQMAGIVFRYQDPKNYYVLRASAKGNTFRFYKFVAGIRSAPIGPGIPIPRGVWGEIGVECKANKITCLLNGKVVIPEMTDNSFLFGKVGFWTKSDSVSLFSDAQVTYTPRESLASKMARQFVEDRPTVETIAILVPDGKDQKLTVVASNDEQQKDRPATELEAELFAGDKLLYKRDRKKNRVTVYVPLHDRNGDTVALVTIVSKRFFGETERTSLFRGLQIGQAMEKRFTDAKQLTE